MNHASIDPASSNPATAVEADIPEPELELASAVVEQPQLEPELEPEPAPEPLGPTGHPKILVGTSSWTDPSLVSCGRFYPKACTSAEDRLRYYASRFPMVEVDSSRDEFPRSEDCELWVARTPRDFNFDVEVFGLFTGHRTPVRALPAPIRRSLGSYAHEHIDYEDMPAELLDLACEHFKQSIEPLRAAGKLGALIFQFAPSFACSPRAREHLDDLRARLAEYTLAVEFRHESWFDETHRERTIEFEKERGLIHVMLDSPQGLASKLGAHWVLTNPQLAVLKLCGRGAAAGMKSGATAATQDAHEGYSDRTLTALADSVSEIAQKVGEVHVVFDDTHEDQDQRHAIRLMDILGLVR